MKTLSMPLRGVGRLRRPSGSTRALLGVAAASALVVLAFEVGCGGGGSAVGAAKLPAGTRSSAIAHEACNEGGHRVELIDVTNDGKPDIKRVYDGDHEICRITDLNHDGKPDMFEYYDKSGQLRRREADYDDDAFVNSIQVYENGKLVSAELDTTNQGKIDTWDTYDPNTGKLLKRERDSTGDGRVDQWWTYEGDKVTIAMDRNGDGLPDPESQTVLGGDSNGTAGDGGAPPPAPSAAPPADTGAPAAPLAPTLNTPDAGATPKRGGAKR
jgi:hypothetical protein